jgi:hypothetical protein
MTMTCELEVLNIFWLCIGLMIAPRLTLGCMFLVLGYPWIAAVVWADMVVNQVMEAHSAYRRDALEVPP